MTLRAVGVLTHPAPDLSAPYFVEILAGLRRALGPRLWVNPPRTADVAGWVWVAPEGRSPRTPPGAPAVVVNGRRPGLPSFDVDNAAAARAVVERFLAAGHRRVAHIAGKLDTANGRDRRRGYRSALRAAGVRPSPEWEIEARFDRRRGRAAMEKFLRAASPPTAVFAANDAMALGAREALCGAGRARAVALAGFDDVPEARRARLTTVRPPLRALAAEAGRVLRRWMATGRRPRAGVRKRPARLVVRSPARLAAR